MGVYLSECTTLGEGIFSRDIVYEVGGPSSGGLLSKLNLPDVTIKPHRDLVNLSLGVAGILALGAVATAVIIKNKRYAT